MKSIKVFWMDKQLRDMYPHATWFQVIKWRVAEFLKACVRFIFKLSCWSAVAATVFAAGYFYSRTDVVYATLTEEKIVEKLITEDAPIMDRIAGCESLGNPKSKGIHFDKNGQVLVRGNTNRTVDVGRYQINSVWFKKATDLGLDVFKEEDNKKMAYWIYHTQGTEPWYASEKCWK